ncbi:MAG: hypothetical protein PHS32_04785 [Rhodoferax sp.]|uniref:hypothetical protein n=1 Tax=Rhodoferax sp. TaxID=50421 RepID=UPI00260FEEDC|nr:hypothetical protein [Rhodoferax sp.]MDD5333043.1 hypothetical protein [Rhodoferax sp.]
MAGASAFLGGAKGRLLAASIPFRFFAAAVLFQLLAWAALFWAAPDVANFAGGLGWPLAALHLVTLGVLLMTVMGASLQLLPVATRQAVAPQRWPYDWLWCLYTLGVLGVTTGMATAWPPVLWIGALAVATALLFYLVLLARNLRGARGMPLVVLHAWAACLSLLLLLASGLSLAGAYSGVIVLERQSAIALHVTFAGYGFMGLLVMGFSYILVPMFALSDNPPAAWSWLSLGLALTALVAVFLVVLGLLPPNFIAWSIALAGIAFLLHVALMERALHSGMRRGLGSSFVLVRIGWDCLAASLALALAIELEASVPHGLVLFGVLLIGGLLTLLLGMLSRIVPFLAAMHAGAGMRRPPTASNMTQQQALDVHLYCHATALLLLLGGVLLDSPWLLRAAAASGTLGAAAFAHFFFHAWRRMTALLRKNGTPENAKPS